jgi:hypothetical protein
MTENGTMLAFMLYRSFYNRTRELSRLRRWHLTIFGTYLFLAVEKEDLEEGWSNHQLGPKIAPQ